MKTNSTEAAPDAKTAFYAEELRLLEIVGPEGHAAILDELDKLEEIGLPAEVPAVLCPVPEDTPEISAVAELDESPPVGGPLGHDAYPAGRWLPPVAYSSAVWEALCAPPRCVLEAFDALARHDALVADPLDGTGIQLALEWEWERAEHGIPEGIAREDLVDLTGVPPSSSL
ncbi:MAG: hypothetical protein M3R38_21850 [Actinomycetota bacterium]|nr:hypothetical protein [Actinomycetota bacterium]